MTSFSSSRRESVRASTTNCPPSSLPSQPAVNSTLTKLRVCSEEDVRRAIVSSPTTSCIRDPIPTFILKGSLDVLLTFVTAMVNASLRDGRLPASQKTAIITPLLKKPSLDAGDLKSYRPVSNLTFMSDCRFATYRILADKRSDAAVAIGLPVTPFSGDGVTTDFVGPFLHC